MKVGDGVRATKRDRDDVVVLDIEVRATLDTTSSVALEDGAANLAGDDFSARLLREGVGRQDCVCPFELALLAALAFIDERVDILRGEAVVIPVEATAAPPVLSSVVAHEYSYRVPLLRRRGIRKLSPLHATGCVPFPGVEDVALPEPDASRHKPCVLRLAQHDGF